LRLCRPSVSPSTRLPWSWVLGAVASRLRDNYPYFHPLYAGQMLKPPHPLARAAYALAMSINPNNHARDGGRASSEMEIEAVRQIAAMFGWAEYLGHLASSGTFANLEALWVAGQLEPAERIVGSEQAHYTHRRISAVLKLEYAEIPADSRGRMSMEALEAELRKGDVGTVVATLGTTAIGAVDPLDQILALKQRYGFRIHVDAAYGGYFTLIPDALDEPARRAYAAIGQADSIVIDPHKHGLQPYGCGCVLFRDPAVGRFLQARLPLHLLHVETTSPGRDQPGVLARRGGCRGLVGYAAALAAGSGRRVCARSRARAVPRLSNWIGACVETRVSSRWQLARRSWISWSGSWRPARRNSSQLAQNVF
jgi:glutamate/tyrosine decarboxylase-like PLP-dependent enzyme